MIAAKCATLSSTSDITMIKTMITAAMTNAARGTAVPSSYINIAVMFNSCAGGQPSSPRRRSLSQETVSSTAVTSSQISDETDGTATLKITVTWPAEVVTSSGLNAAQAALAVADCTSQQSLSSAMFTPPFMTAYGISWILPTRGSLDNPIMMTTTTTRNGEGSSFIIPPGVIMQQPDL